MIALNEKQFKEYQVIGLEKGFFTKNDMYTEKEYEIDRKWNITYHIEEDNYNIIMNTYPEVEEEKNPYILPSMFDIPYSEFLELMEKAKNSVQLR